jgi:ribonuclease-3
MTVRLFDCAPVYVLTDVGPAHDKWYTATVLVNGEALGVGEGRSKKVAEQAAADHAIGHLEATQAPADPPVSGSDA